MAETHYTPPDYKEMEKYGSCGESCVVVLTKAPSVEEQIRYQIRTYGHMWTNVREIEEMLKTFHYATKRCRGGKAKELPNPNTKQALVFIQWLDKNGKEYYWREAQKNIHCILMQKEEDGTWIWDNSYGWLKKEEWEECGGFNLGYVRSYLELAAEPEEIE